MTDQEIKDFFDENLDCTMRTLAQLAGRTVSEIEAVLMEEEE